jgi:hypothetical protein
MKFIYKPYIYQLLAKFFLDGGVVVEVIPLCLKYIMKYNKIIKHV